MTVKPTSGANRYSAVTGIDCADASNPLNKNSETDSDEDISPPAIIVLSFRSLDHFFNLECFSEYI